MAENNYTDDFLKFYEEAFKKTVEANTNYWKDAASVWKKAYSERQDRSTGGMIDHLLNTWSTLLQSQVKFAEDMYRLQLDFSKNIAAKMEASPAPDSSEKGATTRSVQRKEIHLSGEAGGSTAMMLQLNSNDQVVRQCHFEASGFIQLETGRFATLGLHFDPNRFELVPGQGLEVMLQVSIPEKATPGHYRSTVHLVGYNDTVFDLHVEVKATAIIPVKATVRTKTTPTKSTAKKSPPKKKS